MKVDANNIILVKYIILKFTQRLKSQIMLLVYVKNLITLNNTIIVTRQVKEGLDLINKSKEVYVLKKQIIQLNKQINILAKKKK